MTHSSNNNSDRSTKNPVKVWDLPIRLFHWLLVVLLIASVSSARIGGNLMTTHMLLGYFVLALLIFRLIWGFLGGHHARFTEFVRGPTIVWRYAISFTRKDAPRYLGHNPLGAWSVITMLTVLLLQASTGLFASDDIFTEGPLYPLVSNDTSSLLTRFHNFNAIIIGILVAIHLMAVLFYLIVKGENLIKPMFTGRKIWHGEGPPCGGNLWTAVLVAGLSGVLVYLIVN